MKLRVFRPFTVAILLISGLALAQSKPDAEKKDPRFFVKVAANVASNVQHQDLNGFLAIYVDSQSWASGLKDSDLGPFLKLKEEKPGRCAVIFFSQDKDVAMAVFFDGESAFGAAAVKAGANGKIETDAISSAYKPVSKEMLKETGQEFQFNSGEAATDDGQPLVAFQVASSSKKLTN